jgi:hypothetical protein
MVVSMVDSSRKVDGVVRETKSCKNYGMVFRYFVIRIKQSPGSEIPDIKRGDHVIIEGII